MQRSVGRRLTVVREITRYDAELGITVIGFNIGKTSLKGAKWVKTMKLSARRHQMQVCDLYYLHPLTLQSAT